MKGRTMMERLSCSILLIPLFVLGGCVTLDENGCRRVSTTLKARDDGNGGGNGASFIRIDPDTVKLDEKCSFVINNPQGHLIHTTSTEADWLISGDPTTLGIILGPAKGNPGRNYKYKILVDGIGELDPRAHIRR
jgi:hypothetical protein